MGTKETNERPTLLLIGDGEPMLEALRVQLERLRVSVERAPTREATTAVTAAAPDLVLLVGDAAKGGGTDLLRRLAASPVTSVVPVALLLDDASLDQRLRAFRSGAVAVIQRSASAYAIAERIAELAKELPERSGEAAGVLGEATLEELVSLVSQELRSGILSVEGAVDQPIRLVLGAGGPVAEALQDFVTKLKPLVAEASPLRYELLETAGGRLKLLDPEDHPKGDLAILRGLRILLMDDDPGRADVLAQALRSHHALVGVTEVSTRGLERARGLDPTLIVLDAQALDGAGFEVVRAIRRDLRLRWAAMLLARWDELWPKGAASPDLEELAGRLAPLVEPDLAFAERAAQEGSFDTRVELTGPSRLLRATGRLEGTRHLTVRATKSTLELDVADGLVVGATARPDDGAPVEGLEALALFLATSSARVHVERREHPATATIMSPVDEALEAALALVPASAPSRPPPPLLREKAVPFPTADELRTSDLVALPDDDDEPSMTGPVLVPPRVASSRDDVGVGTASKEDLSWGAPRAPSDEHERETAAPTASDELDALLDDGARAALASPKVPKGAFAPPPPPARTLARITPTKKATMVGVAPPPTTNALASRPSATRRSLKSTMVGVAPAPEPESQTPTVKPPEDAAEAKPRAAHPRVDEKLGEDEPTLIGDSLAISQALAQSGELSLDDVGPSRADAPEREGTTSSEQELALGDTEVDGPAITVDAVDAPMIPLAPSQALPPPRAADPEDTDIMTRPVRRGRGPLIAAIVLLVLGGAAAVFFFFGAELAPEAHREAMAALGLGSGSESSGSETETGAETGSGAETGAETGSETGAEIGAEIGAETGAGTETGSGAETGAGTETGSGAETGTGSGSETGSEAETETGAETEPEADTGTGTGTETEMGTAAETGRAGAVEAPAIDPGLDRRERAARAVALAERAEQAVAEEALDEAARLLREADAYDDANPATFAAWAAYHLARGDAEAAVTAAESAARRMPRRASYHVLVGDARQAAGQTAGARRAWRRALEVSPNDPTAMRRLGQ